MQTRSYILLEISFNLKKTVLNHNFNTHTKEKKTTFIRISKVSGNTYWH